MDRMELLAATAQTASGNTAAFQIPTLTMAQLEVAVSAASGTPTFDLWLEVSSDGKTWYEMPFDFALKSTGVAAEDTCRAAGRDVVNGKTTTSAENFLGIYKHLPAGWVRARWTISGTSASVTFGAVLAGK